MKRTSLLAAACLAGALSLAAPLQAFAGETAATTQSTLMTRARALLAGVLAATNSPVQAAARETITVFKDPNCGCCHGWAQYMREQGFDVKETPTKDMLSVKQRLGVPADLASCHTAIVESTGQVIEGHVPAMAVRKMIAAVHEPATGAQVRGIAVPGMPMNSPGMGQMDGQLTTVDFEGKPFSKD